MRRPSSPMSRRASATKPSTPPPPSGPSPCCVTSATPPMAALDASHSGCWALCDHPRGIDEEQLDGVKACGGLAQITAMPGFLLKVPEKQRNHASVEAMVDHVDHAVARIGIEHVGLSSDFDGG